MRNTWSRTGGLWWGFQGLMFFWLGKQGALNNLFGRLANASLDASCFKSLPVPLSSSRVAEFLAASHSSIVLNAILGRNSFSLESVWLQVRLKLPITCGRQLKANIKPKQKASQKKKKHDDLMMFKIHPFGITNTSWLLWIASTMRGWRTRARTFISRWACRLSRWPWSKTWSIGVPGKGTQWILSLISWIF